MTELQQQTLLMKVFKRDTDDALYNWMKREYIDSCSNGDSCINSMLDKFKNQEKADEDELEYIVHIYMSYVVDYLKFKNSPPGTKPTHRPW